MIRKIATWILLVLAIGFVGGCTSAIFLITLDWVTAINGISPKIYYLLPVGGLIIGLTYFRAPAGVSKGNNVLLEAHENNKLDVPILIAPIVYLSTLVTHLLGGSAGREGTAVQMSGAIAYQFSKFKKPIQICHKTLISMGIAAGFSGVFGTPLAGFVFAFELFPSKSFNCKSIIPVFLASIISHFVCIDLFQIQHTEYHIFSDLKISTHGIFSVIFAGILFGLTVRLFVISANLFSKIGNYAIPISWLNPVIAGILLIFIYRNFPCTPFYGLGIEEIKKSFFIISRDSDFLVKLLLTTFTLSFGFKGGEVTPLFFIGATFGSSLSAHLGLPIDMLTGIGFICVFAGATQSPIAGIFMSMELFGTTNIFYFALSIVITHFFSGEKGIYAQQQGLFQPFKIEKLWLKVFKR